MLGTFLSDLLGASETLRGRWRLWRKLVDQSLAETEVYCIRKYWINSNKLWHVRSNAMNLHRENEPI